MPWLRECYLIGYEKAYEVEIAAPGLTKGDFKIHLDGEGNLLINMEKKTENKEEKKHGRFLRREFSYEKFQQSLMLPDDVDTDKIDAHMENGVLNICLPKLEIIEKPVLHRQIEIQ